MYADKLVKVKFRRLIKNKKYYIIRTQIKESELDEDTHLYDTCDVFTGFYISSNTTRHYYDSDRECHSGSDSDAYTHKASDSESGSGSENEIINFIGFKNLRNMITLKKLKCNWWFDSNQIKCFEIKPMKQKSMEDSYFKRIVKNLIGDNKFKHYLFEDLKTDYEMLQDDLISDNTDYEIHEVMSNSSYKKYWFIMDCIINIFKKINKLFKSKFKFIRFNYIN
jgi:hypothetical protein